MTYWMLSAALVIVVLGAACAWLNRREARIEREAVRKTPPAPRKTPLAPRKTPLAPRKTPPEPGVKPEPAELVITRWRNPWRP